MKNWVAKGVASEVNDFNVHTTNQNCAMDNKIPEYHTADIGWSKVENKKEVERLREQCTNMLR